jgi:hypothetical protein
MVLAFFENERREIRKVVAYAKNYIYQTDDLLDMKNGELSTPSEDPKHMVLVGAGRWICYFLVDHPNKGRCHYFHVKPDLSGEPPDKPQLEYIVKEFGIESPLLQEHIEINKEEMVVNIVLPIGSK